MKKSTYTRTALASLLTLCSVGGFAADFPSENMREIKKQESTNISGKPEVMKTSNKKLKEKMDRICNAVPRKKADEIKKKEEAKLAAEQKKKDELRLASEKKKEEEMKLANEKNAKLKDEKDKSKDSKANAKDSKNGKDLKNDPKKDKAVNAKDSKIETKVKPAVNKNIEDKSKAKAIETKKSGDTDFSLQTKSGLRITFGGVVDAQGHGKAGPSGDEYKRYNFMAGGPKKYTNYYDVDANKIKGANPLFPQGIGNVGDYSNDFGTVADAILHLRAENKNEDLGLLYGADVQFHVPVTEGKGASQGVYAARGRGAHLFVNSEYGDVKLGYQFGPEALMRLDATRIATVDGGADSDWFRKVNVEGSAASFPFYVTPRLWTESFSSESEKLSFRMAGKYNKGVMTTLPFRVAYYSPNYMGARFGVSYAPRYESSLFSVSDNIAASSSGNPYTNEIENITKKFLEAGKLTVPDDFDVGAVDAKLKATAGGRKVTVTGDAFPAGELDKAIAALAIKIEAATDLVVEDKAKLKNKYSTSDGEIAAVFNEAKVADPSTGLDAAIKAKFGAISGANVTVADLTKNANAVLKENRERRAVLADVEAKVKEQDKLAKGILISAFDGGSPAANQLRHVGPDYEHILSAGVHYEYDFDEYKLNVKASAVGEYGQAKQPNEDKHIYSEYVEYNNLMGANFGVNAHYKIDEDQSAKFAASFAYLGKSGQPKGIKTLNGSKYEALGDGDPRVAGIKAQFVGDDKNTMYWTAGAGYQRENIYTSLTYFGSKANDGDKLHHIALGVQYDLSPACSKSKFIPYASLQYFITEEIGNEDFKAKGKKTAPPNKGVHLLTGVKFSF